MKTDTQSRDGLAASPLRMHRYLFALPLILFLGLGACKKNQTPDVASGSGAGSSPGSMSSTSPTGAPSVPASNGGPASTAPPNRAP